MKRQYFGAVEIKSLDDATGIGEGYAAVFDNVDYGGDRILFGAFKSSIKSNLGKVPILWQHDDTKPIGVGLSAEEDNHGLKVRFQLTKGVQLAEETIAHIKAGSARGLSIGYSVKNGGAAMDGGVRNLKDLNLHEYSVVTFPMNDLAGVTSMKNATRNKFAKLVDIRTALASIALPDGIKFFKADDFQSALAEAESLDALWDERYTMESALRDVISDVQEDTGLDLAGKKKAIGTSLAQYAIAMSDWWSRYLDIVAGDGDGTDMSDMLDQAGMMARIADIERKEGRALSQANLEKLQAIVAQGKAAQASLKKGIDMAQNLVYANLYRLDKYPDQPSGGNKADGPTESEVAEILDATKRATALLS